MQMKKLIKYVLTATHKKQVTLGYGRVGCHGKDVTTKTFNAGKIKWCLPPSLSLSKKIKQENHP